MTDIQDTRWWQALPPAEAELRCGAGRHVIRWADGSVSLPEHPDAEAELVLGALGGEKAACVEVAAMWGRHSDDLEVLALGPRWEGDQLDISWDDVEALQSRPSRVIHRGSSSHVSRTMVAAVARPRRLGPGRSVISTLGVPQHITGQLSPPVEELSRKRSQRLEVLTLLAFGPAFQLRLAGTVAAAWAERAGDAGFQGGQRPPLVAALAGRLAAAAGTWLGIDPDLVTVSLHEGGGWGSLELTGAGTGHGLQARLPIAWLASVWAAGLAVVEGHLVVTVQMARWPDARVLAVPEPGAPPVTLSVHDAGGSGDGAHWMVTGLATGTAEEAAGT